jgi:hypothetical protein
MTFKDNIHSYDPGFSLNGVVWTTRVLPDSVDIDLRNGTAQFSVEDLAVSDWFSLPNGFRQGKHVPATVTFDVRWDTPLEQVRIRDPQVGFRAEHVENQATIEWSAEQEGFRFVSDPAETSSSTDSKVGRERNGVFFR